MHPACLPVIECTHTLPAPAHCYSSALPACLPACLLPASQPVQPIYEVPAAVRRDSSHVPARLPARLQGTYDLLKRTVAALPEGPLHLVVLSGIPVIFPKASSPAQLPSPAAAACPIAQLPACPLPANECTALLAWLVRVHRTAAHIAGTAGTAACTAPRLQVPAAESILGCFGRVTRSIPAINRMARTTGEPLLAWLCRSSAPCGTALFRTVHSGRTHPARPGRLLASPRLATEPCSLHGPLLACLLPRLQA